MARTKAFDRDKALLRAMHIFWEQGYEATSTDDLLHAMGIGRQSMYDTFGDKHRLYVEALQRYLAEYALVPAAGLAVGVSPLAALEAVLLIIAEQTPSERARGCMGVNAITELAAGDHEVASMLQANGDHCEAIIAQVVRAAQRQGQIDSALDAGQAGRFLLSTLQGLRVSAKAGATPAALRDIAALALRGLIAR